jgi:hypothetical protein
MWFLWLKWTCIWGIPLIMCTLYLCFPYTRCLFFDMRTMICCWSLLYIFNTNVSTYHIKRRLFPHGYMDLSCTFEAQIHVYDPHLGLADTKTSGITFSLFQTFSLLPFTKSVFKFISFLIWYHLLVNSHDMALLVMTLSKSCGWLLISEKATSVRETKVKSTHDQRNASYTSSFQPKKSHDRFETIYRIYLSHKEKVISPWIQSGIIALVLSK